MVKPPPQVSLTPPSREAPASIHRSGVEWGPHTTRAESPSAAPVSEQGAGRDREKPCPAPCAEGTDRMWNPKSAIRRFLLHAHGLAERSSAMAVAFLLLLALAASPPARGQEPEPVPPPQPRHPAHPIPVRKGREAGRMTKVKPPSREQAMMTHL